MTQETKYHVNDRRELVLY